jgi:hypothetical protein
VGALPLDEAASRRVNPACARANSRKWRVEARGLLFRRPVRPNPESRMQALAALTILLSAADHWTTYLCLRAPIAGWQVAEANPLAQWLFDSFGLIPGLMIDSGVTLGAIAFLLSTHQIPKLTKGLFFGLVIVGTSVAVYNNWIAIQALGLSPLGSA